MKMQARVQMKMRVTENGNMKSKIELELKLQKTQLWYNTNVCKIEFQARSWRSNSCLHVCLFSFHMRNRLRSVVLDRDRWYTIQMLTLLSMLFLKLFVLCRSVGPMFEHCVQVEVLASKSVEAEGLTYCVDLWILPCPREWLARQKLAIAPLSRKEWTQLHTVLLRVAIWRGYLQVC